MAYPVKYITSTMRGAPELPATAGSMIALLDAFLITGFGATTAASVTVAGGIATATHSAGQGFTPGCIVLVAGATPEALNGEARVLTASSTSITWATAAPDGTASGTITIKVAPVGGWEKRYIGTNKAVYRSVAAGASGGHLRVDHTTGNQALVMGYAGMTDVDTGTAPFPTAAQLATPAWPIAPDSSSLSTARRYFLFADARFIVIAITHSADTSNVMTAEARGFGDLLGDPYCCVLSAILGANVSTQYSGAFSAMDPTQAYAVVASMRDAAGVGTSARGRVLSYVGARTPIRASGNQDVALGPFPSPIDARLRLSRMFFTDTDNLTPRADVPGIFFAPHSGLAARFSPGDLIAGEGDLAGRTLMAVPCGNGTFSDVATGYYFVDTTGPWR